MEKYTTNTSSLKATKADIRLLDSKKSNSDKIYLRNQDIEELWGFDRNKDFKKLVHRYDIKDDDNFILWTDSGDLAYINFADKIVDGSYMLEKQYKITNFNFDLSALKNAKCMFADCDGMVSFNSNLGKLEDGTSMFRGCLKLSEFNTNLDSLKDGTGMFSDCCSLTSFKINLPNLINTAGMFSGCSLDKESVFHILNCLKNNECMNTTAKMSIGINASLRTDPEIMELLEIDLVSSYTNEEGDRPLIPTKKEIMSKARWNMDCYVSL